MSATVFSLFKTSRTNRLLPFDMILTALKMKRPTNILLLHVYSLPR
jgi:hypothetical protein